MKTLNKINTNQNNIYQSYYANISDSDTPLFTLVKMLNLSQKSSDETVSEKRSDGKRWIVF